MILNLISLLLKKICDDKYLNFAIPVLLLVVLSFFPIFLNLGEFHIRMWDEATYANNAIDMFTSGNYMVAEQLGQVDFYNTKPPFVLWCQVICMKFLGINELAVRLPSAIFGMLTILMVFFFSDI